LNVLSPSDSALGSASVIVTRAGEPSVPFQIRLVSALPGIFTFSPQNGRYAAATLADGSYLGPPGLFGTALATVQAKPGDVVVLYGTGCGPTIPPVPADRVFSGSAQLANPVRATIGGIAATVHYAGMTGAGLCQFNLVVPEVADGDQAVGITLGNLAPVGAFIPVRR
jgi:uncharacterized protein (TIGR03437 family)